MAKLTYIRPIGLLMVWICLANPTFADETKSAGGAAAFPVDSRTGALVNQILKCKSLAVTPARQKEFIYAFSLAYAKMEACGSEPPGRNEVLHLFAMIMEETGDLKTLSEGKSKYASSSWPCKGRGPIQITTHSVYENCAKFMRGDIGGSQKQSKTCDFGVQPATIDAIDHCDRDNGAGAEQAIGQSGVGEASVDIEYVKQPQLDSAYYSALCSLSWWQNAKKLKQFANVVNGGSETCAAVGKVCSTGSGTDKPLPPAVQGVVEKSTAAFNRIAACVPPESANVADRN